MNEYFMSNKEGEFTGVSLSIPKAFYKPTGNCMSLSEARTGLPMI